MIDGICILIKNANFEHLNNSKPLEFFRSYSEKTGEVLSKRIAHYRHCRIIWYDDNKLIVRGSLHKYWNKMNGVNPIKNNKKDMGYNGNLFTYSNYLTVVEDLSYLLGSSAKEMIIRSIEFGVNCKLYFDLKLFVPNLLYHRGKIPAIKSKGNYTEFIHQRYILKVYDKSYIQDYGNNILRVELKFQKMEDLNPLAVTSLADITSSIFDRFSDLLIAQFNVIIYYDETVNTSSLKQRDRNALLQYQNFKFWDNLKSNHIYRHKKRLNCFIKNHSKNLKEIIITEIINTCSRINPLLSKPKCSKTNQHSSINSCSKINPLNSGLINNNLRVESKSKKCKLTGVEISMQNSKSSLLSHTGLKYYEDENPKLFKTLKGLYLTDTWKDGDDDIIIKEMAHNIRNHYYNRLHRTARLYNYGQPQLFGDLPPPTTPHSPLLKILSKHT